MGDFLKGLGQSIDYGAGGQDSEGQLKQAQGQDYSQYDQKARSQGFRNGEEMVQWMRQRQATHQGTAPAGSQEGVSGAAMMHPKNLFKYVMDRYSEATGQ